MDNSNTENTTNSFMYKVKEEFKDVKGDLGPLFKQLTFLMIAALLFLISTKPNKNTTSIASKTKNLNLTWDLVMIFC